MVKVYFIVIVVFVALIVIAMGGVEINEN